MLSLNEKRAQEEYKETEAKKDDLLPCPFCGGGVTLLKRNEAWMGGIRPNQLLSVEVRHWCERWDKMSSRCLILVGETEESAIKRWNTRNVK